MWRMRSDLPLWIGPSTRWVRPCSTARLTSCRSGAPAGPVRWRTASAGPISGPVVGGLDKARDDGEDRVDERVGAEDADHAEDHRPRRRAADRGDVALHIEPLVGGDDGDRDREDDRLPETDDDVAHGERALELLDEDAGAEAD